MSREAERGDGEAAAALAVVVIVCAAAAFFTLVRAARFRESQAASNARPPTMESRRTPPRTVAAPTPSSAVEEPLPEATRPPLGDPRITILDPTTNAPLPAGTSKGLRSVSDPGAVLLKIRVSDEVSAPRIGDRGPTSSEKDGDATVLGFVVPVASLPTRGDLGARGMKGLLPLQRTSAEREGDRFVVITYRLPTGDDRMPEQQAIFAYETEPDGQ